MMKSYDDLKDSFTQLVLSSPAKEGGIEVAVAPLQLTVAKNVTRLQDVVPRAHEQVWDLVRMTNQQISWEPPRISREDLFQMDSIWGDDYHYFIHGLYSGDRVVSVAIVDMSNPWAAYGASKDQKDFGNQLSYIERSMTHPDFRHGGYASTLISHIMAFDARTPFGTHTWRMDALTKESLPQGWPPRMQAVNGLVNRIMDSPDTVDIASSGEVMKEIGTLIKGHVVREWLGFMLVYNDPLDFHQLNYYRPGQREPAYYDMQQDAAGLERIAGCMRFIEDNGLMKPAYGEPGHLKQFIH